MTLAEPIIHFEVVGVHHAMTLAEYDRAISELAFARHVDDTSASVTSRLAAVVLLACRGRAEEIRQIRKEQQDVSS